MKILQTLKNMEHVRFLLLLMNLQDYFYIDQPFLLYIQELHKIINGALSDLWYWLNSNILVSSEGVTLKFVICYFTMFFPL